MINKTTKKLKISSLTKVILSAAVFALLFFSFGATPTFAQFYPQAYPYGNTYTYPNNYSPFYIATTNATNIGVNSVTLNGQVNGTSLYSTYNISTWFQYGTSTNLELSTVVTPSNSGYAEYSSNVAGLYPNTIYYFRAVAQTPLGTIYGSTNSFRTNFANNIVYSNPVNSALYANPVNTAAYNPNVYTGTQTAITQPPTSVSGDSAELNSLILNPSLDPNTVTWFDYGDGLNLGKATTIVSVGSVPSVRHVNSMTGLTQGTTYYFRAVVQNSYSKNNGSVLSFTTAGTKPTVIVRAPVVTSTDTVTKVSPPPANPPATATPDTGAQSSLGANVFGAGSFLPVNIFGWLTLIILILVLVLVGKHALGGFSPKKSTDL